MSKILVSYFSASGITKAVSERVASAINGDLFEIEPVEKYTDEDLDWTNKKSRSSIEMNDKSSRPAVKNKVENIDEYNAKQFDESSENTVCDSQGMRVGGVLWRPVAQNDGRC